MPAEPITECFHLGVVAPLGFDAPGLDRRAWARVLPLIRDRRDKKHRVSFFGVGYEPITRAVREAAEEMKFIVATVGPVPDRHRLLAHRAACAHVASISSAVVVFQGPGELCPEMRDVLDWCGWLGVPTRVVRIPDEADPESP